VIPELQRRNLFRTDYQGKTLRENLELDRPPNRYVTGAALPPSHRVRAASGGSR